MMARGTRVELTRTTDPHTNLAPGDQGTVLFIDGAGTIHVRWDNGAVLGLIPGEDEWRDSEETSGMPNLVVEEFAREMLEFGQDDEHARDDVVMLCWSEADADRVVARLRELRSRGENQQAESERREHGG